jgi:hypothetical protein
MRCPNCNKEMSDFIDVYKCCHCDLQIEKTITEQQKIDELNQKWLEAIKDWKKIIAEKDQHIKELEDAIKCSNLLIEQLENQNDRLIKQRDNAEQELAFYKKALEIKLKQELKETNELLGIMGATPLTYDDLFQGVLIEAKELLEE